MTDLRKKRFIAAGILTAIAFAMFLTWGMNPANIAVFLLGAWIVVWGEKTDRENANRLALEAEDKRHVKRLIEHDFETLDEITPDVRWLGAEAKIVHWRWPIQYSIGFTEELLCRTNKGTWFVVAYELNGYEIVRRQVHRSDEATAKEWLAPRRETYIEFFGTPETA